MLKKEPSNRKRIAFLNANDQLVRGRSVDEGIYVMSTLRAALLHMLTIYLLHIKPACR